MLSASNAAMCLNLVSLRTWRSKSRWRRKRVATRLRPVSPPKSALVWTKSQIDPSDLITEVRSITLRGLVLQA